MRFLPRTSLTFRITFLFSLGSTAVLLLLGLLVASLTEKHFVELDVGLLTGKLELLGHSLEQMQSEKDLERLRGRLDDALVGHQGLAVRIRSLDGTLLYGMNAADFGAVWPPRITGLTATPSQWTDGRGHSFRGLVQQYSLAVPGVSGAIVEVGTDLSHHEHFMHSFQEALWTVVGIAAFVTGFLGWGAARTGLSPLRRITRQAAEITATRLDMRLLAEAIPAEVEEVVHTLNRMLARLEDSFNRLTDFSSDLAHELRTPVSNLLTQTQVMLSKTRSIEEYQDVLASNVEELERLGRMIADMLFLAKADNGLAMPNRERVDLRNEVDGVIEYYEALASENRVRLTVTGQASVAGDRLMLRRALGNLLSNAFRYTPEGGAVAIRLQPHEATRVTVEVENTGDTIPEEHLPRLFDRFYRADPARSKSREGVGLGLAITRSIARAHGGEASVRSADGRTVFALHLPVAPQSA